MHAARYQFSKLISIVTFVCACIEHIHLGAVLTFENLSLKAPTEFSVATHQMMQQLSVMSAFFFFFVIFFKRRHASNDAATVRYECVFLFL